MRSALEENTSVVMRNCWRHTGRTTTTSPGTELGGEGHKVAASRACRKQTNEEERASTRSSRNSAQEGVEDLQEQSQGSHGRLLRARERWQPVRRPQKRKKRKTKEQGRKKQNFVVKGIFVELYRGLPHLQVQEEGQEKGLQRSRNQSTQTKDCSRS